MLYETLKELTQISILFYYTSSWLTKRQREKEGEGERGRREREGGREHKL